MNNNLYVVNNNLSIVEIYEGQVIDQTESVMSYEEIQSSLKARLKSIGGKSSIRRRTVVFIYLIMFTTVIALVIGVVFHQWEFIDQTGRILVSTIIAIGILGYLVALLNLTPVLGEN